MTWIGPEFKYLSQWKYVELAHWLPNSKKLMREKENDLPVMIEWKDVPNYARLHEYIGVYTSVWLYDTRDLDRARRLGSLYFDLDSDQADEAYRDTIKLVRYLVQYIPREGIRVYFSGSKGFHVECEAVVLGITPSNTLPDLYRYIAGELRSQLELTTIDFAVYDARRIWRLPNTINQKTNLYKIPLTGDLFDSSLEAIKEAAKNPIQEDIQGLTFNAKANEWYREWTYKQDAGKQISMQERMDRFNKHGTNLIQKGYDEEQIFDPESLFTHCPALLKIWEKAEREHHLLHDERLFLCSILTYTDEAIEYLFKILSNCDDFNYDKSKSHIDDWIRRREADRGGHPYSCEKVNAMGIGCGNCALKPIEKKQKVGSHWVGSGEYSQPSPYRFAYSGKKDFVSHYPAMIKEDEMKHI